MRLRNVLSEAVASRTIPVSHVTTVVTASRVVVAAATVALFSAVSVSFSYWLRPAKLSRRSPVMMYVDVAGQVDRLGDWKLHPRPGYFG